MRGSALAGYKVAERPLVQTVVATGRVVAVSRAQIGSPVTGVVIERRVREGDRVQAGDVLAVLRADDMEAAVRDAEAALAQLQQSTRPQAQAALREAEARLTQATREAQRRRDLFQQQAIAREEMEQAIQAETTARANAEQARGIMFWLLGNLSGVRWPDVTLALPVATAHLRAIVFKSPSVGAIPSSCKEVGIWMAR